MDFSSCKHHSLILWQISNKMITQMLNTWILNNNNLRSNFFQKLDKDINDFMFLLKTSGIFPCSKTQAYKTLYMLLYS